MTHADRPSHKAPSAWSIEVERFKGLFDRWLDYRLNRFLDLSVNGPGYRSTRMFLLGAIFVIFGLMVHLLLYSSPFLSLIQQNNGSPTSTTQGLILIAALALVQLILLLFIPRYIAIEMAGNYVTDIFELKDPGIAWKFIDEISLRGASEVLHIREGKIVEQDKDSPILLIGGPGRVEVEFDSAVLFEKPDGTPHVIGPEDMRTDRYNEFAVLDGFERLRDPILNLRDQYFGYSTGEAIRVEGRSQDGIPVSANDVRAVFSIRRGEDSEQNPGRERPYSYAPQSMQDLIYGQAVPVLQGRYASGEPGAWQNTMRSMITGEIGTFMSQNKLSEFIASISTPEIEALEFREDTILLQTMQYSSQSATSEQETFRKPTFHPRTELSDHFMTYTEGFSKRVQARGLDLHWIGVGTWKPLNDLVNERHVEAWRIGLENAMRTTRDVLDRAMEEACIEEKLRLIKDVPVNTYKTRWTAYRERRAGMDALLDERLPLRMNDFPGMFRENDAIQREKEKAIEVLLQEFWEQMGSALDFYYKKGIRNNDVLRLENAILKIEALLNIPGRHHIVGGGSFSKVKRRADAVRLDNAPPAPASLQEAEQYRLLLTKVDGSYKVAEAMIANEQRRHPLLTREEAIENIIRRFERYQK